MYTNDDYEGSIEEENDYSDFYNTGEDDINEDKRNNKKPIIIIIILAIVLVAAIVLLFLVFRKEKPIEFTLGLENVTGDNWATGDVTINITIPDETNLKSIKHTINCSKKDCDYVDVSAEKKIIISNNGISNVTVVVTNIDGVENRKDILVKIDKVAPTLILSPAETNITSTNNVCAICEDKESGCKEERVCQQYDKTSKDQTLTVEDNAGNKTTSSKFNVTISSGSSTQTPAPTVTATPVGDPSCSLSVATKGTITATQKNGNAYHGFSSSYSGANETTKVIELNNDDETTKVTYYVKNSAGKTATCSIEVKATNCRCWRDDAGVCYKKQVKFISDPDSKECEKANKHTKAGCAFLEGKGKDCDYIKNTAK